MGVGTKVAVDIVSEGVAIGVEATAVGTEEDMVVATNKRLTG